MKMMCVNCGETLLELWAMDDLNNQRLVCGCGKTNIELIGFQVKVPRHKEAV